MKAHGIDYGATDVWREVEWTDDDARSLSIRAKDGGQQRELSAIVLADFPTRDALLEHALARLPDTVKTLDLDGCTSLTALPELPGVTIVR